MELISPLQAMSRILTPGNTRGIWKEPDGDNQEPPKTMTELLDRFGQAAEEKDKVSVDDIMNAVGRRSFGPILVLGGLVLSAPGISDIPTVPTTMGVFILIVSGQILFGREQFWLPRWLLDRRVSEKTVLKVAQSKWTRGPAKAVDKFVMERLSFLAGPRANYIVAAVSTLLALISPLTELVPLSGIGVGAAMIAFGISLMARDGLMALIGLAISAITVSLAISGLL